MKFCVLAALVAFAALPTAQAGQMSLTCFGTGEFKGSTANGSFNTEGSFELKGSLKMRNWTGELSCSGRINKAYKPRTPNPRFDKYFVEGSHCENYATVTKDLAETGKGYINFVQDDCGHPGDTCETGLFCRVN